MSRYTYQSACCGSSATKTSVGETGKGKIRAGLHGWSCRSCGAKGIKVVRKVNKENQ